MSHGPTLPVGGNVAHVGVKLTLVLGGRALEDFEFKRVDRIRIGRAMDCEVAIDNILLPLYHAEILRERGDYILRDLGSDKGTCVNGRRIESHKLLEGDEISIGKFTLVFNPAPALEGSVASPMSDDPPRLPYPDIARPALRQVAPEVGVPLDQRGANQRGVRREPSAGAMDQHTGGLAQGAGGGAPNSSKKAICCVVAFALLAAPCILLQAQSSARYGNHSPADIANYLECARLPLARSGAYVKGKVVVVDVARHKVMIDAAYNIPDVLWAASAASVGTVVLITERLEIVAEYQDGNLKVPGCRIHWDATLIDYAAKSVLESRSFVGSEPPATVRELASYGSDGVRRVLGESPAAAFQQWLMSLPQKQ